MLGKDKCLEKINLVIVLFIIIFSQVLAAEEIITKIADYNKSLQNSSAHFIQSDGKTVEEGIIYFGHNRIKIVYMKPSKLSLILSNKKGMYINHELKEVQFFNTKKSYINVFFNIFNTDNFLEKSKIELSKDLININENINIEDIFYKLKIIYENNPIKLRKIEILQNDIRIEFGLFNHKQLKNLEKSFFSMINPYLN